MCSFSVYFTSFFAGLKEIVEMFRSTYEKDAGGAAAEDNATSAYYTLLNTGLCTLVVGDYIMLCYKLSQQGASWHCIWMMVVSLPLYKPLGPAMIKSLLPCFTSYYLCPPPPLKTAVSLFAKICILVQDRPKLRFALINEDMHEQAEVNAHILDGYSRKLILVHCIYLGAVVATVAVFGSGLFLVFFPQIGESTYVQLNFT
jgi:hypothetical protein